MFLKSDNAMLKDILIDPHFPNCPVRNILARISDRWSMLILLTLDNDGSSMRYSEIAAKIPDISQKMLTVALRNLNADGLVSRQAYAEIPPRVEYALTERGISLVPHINNLVEWAMSNLNDILNDRKEYAKRKFDK